MLRTFKIIMMKRGVISFVVTVCSILMGNAQDSLPMRASQDSMGFMKGIWLGQFTQYACGVNATYPMVVEIDTIMGNRLAGVFVWDDVPEVPSSKTSLSGLVVGDSIYLSEQNLLSGGDLVLDGVYAIKIIDSNSLEGIWRLEELQPFCRDSAVLVNGGSFSLKKLVPKPLKDKRSEREIVVKETIRAASAYITIRLWDDGREDNDIITLFLNGKVALDHFRVRNKPYELIVPIEKGENLLELYAENVGRIPPNTAAILVKSKGKIIRELVLESDYHKIEAIKIIRAE